MSDWTQFEVELVVADYFNMLSRELGGQSVNKSAHRKSLLSLLHGRSEGSVEFKHQNISAILVRMGLPYIGGYRPRYNYQRLLEIIVLSYLENQKSILEPKFFDFAESKVAPTHKISFETIEATAPKPDAIVADPHLVYGQNPIKINFIELEQRNLELGIKGEALIIDYEKWRLKKVGKENLADQIEWIAKFDDTAGFDILSKNEDGTDKYIEVKTTKLAKDTPIYFSKNEYEFSVRKKDNFYLYRVFDFKSKPRFFSAKGTFDDFCIKEPVKYRGIFS